jgi:SAM-dependent methyltransferase
MTGFSRGNLALRQIVPERLDELAARDPRALASRRDLKRINTLMFQARIMAGLLTVHGGKPRRFLEIGAGDGHVSLAVARRVARRWPRVELVLLDRVDLVPSERLDAFKELGWRVETVTADLFQWVDATKERFDVITANLVLHHFDDAGVARLFRRLMQLAPTFLATEPRRAFGALAMTRLLRLIGANDVTLHDAPASVRAGFAGTELSDLWRRAGGRPIDEGRRGLFTHILAASGEASAP